MSSSTHRTSFLSGVASFAAFAVFTSCVASLHAQQSPTPAAPRTLDLSHPAISLQASMNEPPSLAPAETYSSSASDNTAPAEFSAGSGIGGSDLQPPPRRRRYGRPNYSDKYRNADGSNRFAFVAGGGFNLPVGTASSNYLNLGYRFEVGAGVNMNSKIGALVQFDYDHFGIPGKVLTNQETLYTVVTQDTSGAFQGLGGSSHIWSITLNPTFAFYQSDSIGAYGIVGGGFYHKVTSFTVPATGQYCDYIYGCYQYQTDQVIDHYTSNAPGVTGGVGLTYKFSRWSNERLFAEARFVHTFNQARAADPVTPNNLYPPNSNETSYIPVTFGIRF